MTYEVTIQDGLISFKIDHYTAVKILDKLVSLIRKTIWNIDNESFLKIHRASLIGYQLTKNQIEGVYLQNLSKEDLELLYSLNIECENPNFQNDIATLKKIARNHGLIDIIEADRMAKQFESILTC